MPPNPWSDADAQIVRDNYGKLTCKQIAAALGGRFSRNAVIGKARRMGFGALAPDVRLQHFREAQRQRSAETARIKLKEAPRFRPSAFKPPKPPPKVNPNDPASLVAAALLEQAARAERRRDSYKGRML